MIAVVAWIWIN